MDTRERQANIKPSIGSLIRFKRVSSHKDSCSEPVAGCRRLGKTLPFRSGSERYHDTEATFLRLGKSISPAAPVLSRGPDSRRLDPRRGLTNTRRNW